MTFIGVTQVFTLPSGFPLDFFPVLFAVPRVVGWLAHWRQVSNVLGGGLIVTDVINQMMLQEGGVKIWRPRQVGRREGLAPVVVSQPLCRFTSAPVSATMSRSTSAFLLKGHGIPPRRSCTPGKSKANLISWQMVTMTTHAFLRISKRTMLASFKGMPSKL